MQRRRQASVDGVKQLPPPHVAAQPPLNNHEPRILIDAVPRSGYLPGSGLAGERLGMERQLKANTDKRRTSSVFRQGCMYYQALPHMPEHRLRPLLERFAQLLSQQPVFREAFGVI
jgi:hypothetical protein